MKAKRDRTFFYILCEEGLLKGFFRKKKLHYEILQLSADSRYLWSVTPNFFSVQLILNGINEHKLHLIFAATKISVLSYEFIPKKSF